MLYPAALVIALVPLFAPLAHAWPGDAGDASWRFLLMSVLVDQGATIMAGLVIAFGAAILLDDRRAVRRLGWTALILGFLLMVLVVFLLVHVLLLRAELEPGVTVGDLGATRRLLAGTLLALAFVLLGIGARRGDSASPERSIGSRRTSDRIAGVERP